MRFRVGIVTIAVAGWLAACGGDTVFDTTAPTPVGALMFSDVEGQSLSTSWSASSDDTTTTEALQYKLLYSTQDNMTSIADAEANGSLAMDWSTNTLTNTVSSLTEGVTYYFAVLVRDAAGNKSMYTLASQATTPATPPNIMMSCGTGEVVAGIGGRRGGIIDKLSLLCADVVNGVVDTTSAATGDSVGAEGGQAFADFMCPTGEWVTGVNGGNALGGFTTAMASVQVTCSGGSQSPAINNNVGNNPFTFSCPTGQQATGFEINSTVGGSYAGFMEGIICTQP